MPKDTFYNLSEDKKRKIFDAAVQEFSTRRYSEASINQIIKTAGIPRGSFYQYFKDKEDIYLYMIKKIGKEKQEIIHGTSGLKPDADFFEVYLHSIRVSLKWAKAKPEYNRIGMLMEMDNSEFIAKLREMAKEGFIRLRELIERDKQRDLIKPEIDSDLVIDMIYTLNMNYLFKEYYRTVLDEDIFLKRVNDIISIIKEGVVRRT